MLAEHKPVWATAANDTGIVPDQTMLHLQLLLTRAPQLQTAFEHRLADQQEPTSPLFHHWLTPTQIGQMYGPASADLEAVTSWLAGAGLHVDAIAPSGTFIQVSASAKVIADALGTSFHLYAIPSTGGSTKRTYRAPTVDPSVPSALAPVIGAIEGLSEVPSYPQSHAIASDPLQDKPLFTSTTGAHSLSPADFATIYDVTPLYNAGVTGSGIRVAVIGTSQISPADISNFQTIFSLPVKAANVVIPPLGADPGEVFNELQDEATLDVERVTGTAPGAQIDLVVSSVASGGAIPAIAYNVQTLLDPIMTSV